MDNVHAISARTTAHVVIIVIYDQSRASNFFTIRSHAPKIHERNNYNVIAVHVHKGLKIWQTALFDA